jgi:hypothetical protein
MPVPASGREGQGTSALARLDGVRDNPRYGFVAIRDSPEGLAYKIRAKKASRGAVRNRQPPF